MKRKKISPSDLRVLLSLLPRLEAEAEDGRQKLIERQAEFFALDCHSTTWCHLYEYSFIEHVARVVVALGQENVLNEISAAPNQIEAVASFIKDLDDDGTELSSDEKEAIRPQIAAILGVVTSLLRSLYCLMAYGVYLNDLIAVARSGGERGDKAIYKAIRVDPTIVGAPTVIARISQATLKNDKRFLESVKKAINGGLSKQAQANSQMIRLILQVLRESGAERLSNNELYELFVEELKLYAAPAKADIGDAARGIRAIEDRMKKANATT